MKSTSYKPALLAIGGAHIDRRGQVAGDYHPGASNPGAMREEIGGVVFNALRAAVARGIGGELISLRGGDTVGDAIANAIIDADVVDRSAVFLDRTSASYTAIIDQSGDLIVGFADMQIYDLFPKQLRRTGCRTAIRQADAVLTDANLPTDALNLALAGPGGQNRFAIGISPAKVVRLAGLLDRLDCLFMNRKEAAALTGLEVGAPTAELTAGLRQAGLAGGIITDGGRDVTGFDLSGTWTLTPPPLDRIADVTGAGDALAGATIAALMLGHALPDAMRDGVAAALLTLLTENVVADLNDVTFRTALARVPHAQKIRE